MEHFDLFQPRAATGTVGTSFFGIELACERTKATSGKTVLPNNLVIEILFLKPELKEKTFENIVLYIICSSSSSTTRYKCSWSYG